MLDLDQGPCAIKRLRGCSCGNEYVAVTPNGDIYPCHQFVGEDCWKMGNVLENTLDGSIKDKFARTNVYTKEKCRGCWAKFFCSGGCNANSWQYAGDIAKAHDISCELKKAPRMRFDDKGCHFMSLRWQRKCGYSACLESPQFFVFI